LEGDLLEKWLLNEWEMGLGESERCEKPKKKVGPKDTGQWGGRFGDREGKGRGQARKVEEGEASFERRVVKRECDCAIGSLHNGQKGVPQGRV